MTIKIDSKVLHVAALVLSAVLPAGIAYLSGHPVLPYASTGLVVRALTVLEPLVKKEAASG